LPELFREFRAGKLSAARFRRALQEASAAADRTSEAVLDTRREERAGFPEAIYGAGKTAAQIVRIFRNLLSANGKALATRCSLASLKALKKAVPDVRIHEHAGLAWLNKVSAPPRPGRAAILAAGTSDLPVAEEAAITLEFAGFPVSRFFDIGVAGIHRLMNRLDEIRTADVVIAVAGMEGALPSVVGGLVSAPVIAVPTSVGYGASFQGLAALLGMLNACSAGITVVNIDNGFGAAVAAVRILQVKKDDAVQEQDEGGIKRYQLDNFGEAREQTGGRNAPDRRG